MKPALYLAALLGASAALWAIGIAAAYLITTLIGTVIA